MSDKLTSEMSEREKARVLEAADELLLEISETELREILAEDGEDFDELAELGRAAVERALSEVEGNGEVSDLHRGFAALLQMLRWRDRLTIEELSERARVAISELHGIESDPSFEPSPRTVYQLEVYFKLKPRSLVALSGLIEVDDEVRAEAVRFAASSRNMHELSKEERRLLNRFVRFLSEHTKR